jgi:hypothetical protein
VVTVGIECLAGTDHAKEFARFTEFEAGKNGTIRSFDAGDGAALISVPQPQPEDHFPFEEAAVRVGPFVLRIDRLETGAGNKLRALAVSAAERVDVAGDAQCSKSVVQP